ncbi:MAG: neuraminidase-like domain-containing protein [Candidatus Aminicenantes bacterium]|jgi:hypothetical protein
MKEKENYRIRGTVTGKQDGQGIANLRVEAWDKDLIIDDLLGSTKTDKTGGFALEFDSSYYKELCFDRKPDIYFKVYKGEELVCSTEDSVLWNVTEPDIDIIIKVDMTHTIKKEQFTVSGKIVTNEGVPARGLKVIAVDKNPGCDVILGESVTNDSGDYIITYSSGILQKSGKQMADIEIKVLDPENPAKIYGTSSIHYNAGSDEKINLILQTQPVEKLSEFQQITSDLKHHLGDRSLQDLQEDKERQDISYLANKTGWDARLVAMTSLAEKYSSDTGIPAEFYYALFRAGIPTDEDQLYRLKAETVKRTWEKAVAENIITASMQSQIPQHLATFIETGKTQLLEKAIPVGVSTFKDMLAVSLPDSSKQEEFLELFYHHNGDRNSFWTAVEQKFGVETATRLQLDGKLGYLTLNNAELINKFHTENVIQNNPLELIQNGLYKAETWEQLLSSDIQVPKDIPGETAQEKKKNYIDSMVFQLKTSYPTAVVAEMVNNEEFKMSGENSVKDEVYTFFLDTRDTFEIGKYPVEQFIKDNNLELSSGALNEVKRLQRVYQVSPSDNAMKVLLEKNLDSAHSIVQYDEQEFLEAFGDELGGETAAKFTYAKAHQIRSTILNLTVSAFTYQNNPKPYVISGFSKKEDENPINPERSTSLVSFEEERAELDLVDYPVLEELFGALDYCTCEHCRSVLSPAAYLVDLLHLINLDDFMVEEGNLNLKPPYEEKNPFGILMKRRPDIEHIQLTCENTNTVLPYVDIVNEILEFYAVHDSIEGFEGYNVEEDTNTDLLADPRFGNESESAYTDILNQQVYPFNLPYNYYLEALRLYFDHLKVPLYEAMEKLRVNDDLDIDTSVPDPPPYTWRDIYNEYLIISPEEYEILTDSSASNLPLYFGEDGDMNFDDFNNEYSNAKTFSRKTGITYKQVVEIIKTRFINPDKEIFLQAPKGDNRDCGFDTLEFRYSSEDGRLSRLKEIDYWRLLRFIRLWRKLGLSIDETDKVITALYRNPAEGDSDIVKMDNGFKSLIIKIAHVMKIKEKLNIKRKSDFLELLNIWATVDVPGNDSLALQAAFNLTSDELSLILEDIGLADWDGTSIFDSEQISKIYGYSFLSKSLKLSIQEIILLKTVSGLDPFHELEDVHPHMLQFIELVQLIKQSGFKIMTLGYFLRHEDVTGKASPSLDSVLSFAKTLKDGLVKIEQEHRVEDDPNGEITRSKMALLYDKNVVDQFFGILTGTYEFSVDYSHPGEELEENLEINDKISYDHLKKRLIYRGIMSEDEKDGFRDAEDATDEFKEAVNGLYDKGQDFFIRFPDLKAPYDTYTNYSGPDNEKFKETLNVLLLELKEKLKRLFIKQTLGSSLNIDLNIISQLLEEESVMHSTIDKNKPAIEDFLKLGDNGGPDFKFYLEVPDNGNYNFYIENNTGAAITLSINGLEITGSVSDQIWQNHDAIELTAGKLYLFDLENAGVTDTPVIKWQYEGIDRESIPVNYIYAYDVIRNFNNIYIRILKAAALLAGLKLREEEIRFFSTNLQVDGRGFMNAIPFSPNPDKNQVTDLFTKMMKLFRYIKLKESLNIEDQTLVAIFKDPVAKNEEDESLLLKVTGWNQETTDELLSRFDWRQADLSDPDKFLRMKEAIDVVMKFGVPAAQLLSWTTHEPVPKTVEAVQASLRAKYGQSSWQETLQSINDKLRKQRRDALVSYILHIMRQKEETRGIDTPDKLFEYFLIDVEMDPCMKTSRIKQAISTVQLFIQRCLMNLEKNVSPSSIKVKQWEWMKRYRVWEANRKVFLYPENWLEPELRDNKSPFFQDLESELLQADITDELAEKALLNYLEKLDEVAKLEISAMCRQESETGNSSEEILHVFGRTTGASGKYFYRRLEGGHWTPWEKVDLDIEDNPILPVVWQGRLFLFWLNIVKKGKGKRLTGGESAKEMKNDDLSQEIQETIEINLSWSEYYNHKWQRRKTSDFDNPIKFGEFKPYHFFRSNLSIFSYIGDNGELNININYDEHKGQFILHDKHRATKMENYKITKLQEPPRWRCSFALDSNLKFIFEYHSRESGVTDSHQIVEGTDPFCILQMKPNKKYNLIEDPFFYQDIRHVFFVKVEELDPLILDKNFGDLLIPGANIQWHQQFEFPALVKEGIIETPGIHDKLPGTGLASPGILDFQDKHNRIDKVMWNDKTVTFGNEAIGPNGSSHYNLYNNKKDISDFEMVNITKS